MTGAIEVSRPTSPVLYNSAVRQEPSIQSINGLIHLSLATVVTFSAVMYLATSQLPVANVIRATGLIMPADGVARIQAPASGVIESITVHDGDKVYLGESLVKIGDPPVRRAFDAALLRYQIIIAQRARYEAEANQAIYAGPSAAQSATESVQFISAAREEAALSQARMNSYEAGLALLSGERETARSELIEAQAERALIAYRGSLLQDNLATVKQLFDMQNASKPQLLAAEEAVNDLGSRRAQNSAYLAETRSKIAMLAVQIANARAEFSQKVGEDLRTAWLAEVDARRDLETARMSVRHLDITASSSGTVSNLTIKREGGVVDVGEELLEVVPANHRLVVDVQVKPSEIAGLVPGAAASIKLDKPDGAGKSSFNAGVVTVSANSVLNHADGLSYYKVRMSLSPEGEQAVRSENLPYGSPIAATIPVGKRTLISYFFDPLASSLSGRTR